MPDIEKVINALELCYSGCFGKSANECHYSATEDHVCIMNLIIDAAALLKAMQPRLLTLEELANYGNGETLWVEERQTFTWNLFPMEIHYQGVYTNTEIGYIVFIAYHDLIACDFDGYNRTWRCWSARPTEEQRKAAKWDG